MQVKDLQLKKVLCILLLVLMLDAGMMKVYAVTIGNLTYSLDSQSLTATVTGHKNGTAATGSLVIPASVTYEGMNYSVTTIGDYAFYYCNGLTGSLNIPNSVTMVEEWAFAYCNGFNGTLTIPNSVTTIGESAFYNCGFTELHYNATNCADIDFSSYYQ